MEMKSRDSLPVLGLLVGLGVAALVACGVPDNPLGPSSANSFGPSSVPHGPSGVPHGPSGVPHGPSSAPHGPSGAPGGGGGGPQPPTPAPTPTGLPTPGASATPGGNDCPPTLTVSSNTPFVTLGGGNGPSIGISGFATDCQVTDIRVSLFAETATDLSVHGDFVMAFFHEGVEIGFDLLDPVSQGLNCSTGPGCIDGPSLGTSCANLQFSDGGITFDENPPHVGTFRPRGDPGEGLLGSFETFDGDLVNGTWSLPFYRTDEAITVQCWRIDFELQHASGS